jgi:magnesium chelatase family protein
MVSHIATVSFEGMDIIAIDVQVQISSGIPCFSLVGLADKAVTESRERVRSALYAMGLAMPPKRVTVNLAPADVQKEGSHYDLPIALGLLASLGVVPQDCLNDYVVLGELGLDGRITPVIGALSAAIHAKTLGKGLICPGDSGSEAAWGGDLNILAPHHLLALLNHFKGTQVLSPPQGKLQEPLKNPLDLAHVRGQESGKRALEITAAGGHNLLMVGPPGSGKSMLAARLPSILPSLSAPEALETSMIHSLAGHLQEGTLIRFRPFREPHHSASMPALVGGGLKAKPGEISLAHHGVLFLDELPEFSRTTLEALRQPMEMGKITVARANHHVTYPARFQLVAAMNPCRCGYLDDAGKACRRAPLCAEDYQNRLSGPLLDRFDLTLHIPSVKLRELQHVSAPEEEGSESVRKRVVRARQVQDARFRGLAPDEGTSPLNAHLPLNLLILVLGLSKETEAFFTQACEKLRISARSYHRLLRVARTLADLEGQVSVQRTHLAEALSYRHVGMR